MTTENIYCIQATDRRTLIDLLKRMVKDYKLNSKNKDYILLSCTINGITKNYKRYKDIPYRSDRCKGIKGNVYFIKYDKEPPKKRLKG